jgi:hypothetical protein
LDGKRAARRGRVQAAAAAAASAQEERAQGQRLQDLQVCIPASAHTLPLGSALVCASVSIEMGALYTSQSCVYRQE